MDHAVIRDHVLDALLEIRGLSGPLDDSVTLADLGVDSLDMIEVAMILEERLDVTMKAEDFEGVDTLGAAVGVFYRVAHRS